MREYANMLVEIEGRFEQLEPTQPGTLSGSHPLSGQKHFDKTVLVGL